MKKVNRNDFRMDHGLARRIAESLWGKGGTTSDKCNRPGCYYFSCSGHGGYIIDATSLTDEEFDAVSKILPVEHLSLAVQGGVVLSVRHPFSIKQNPVWYLDSYGTPTWEKHPFFIAEEDCDWAVIEKLTGVRCAWAEKRQMEKNDRKEEVDRMFEAVLRYKAEKNAQKRKVCSTCGQEDCPDIDNPDSCECDGIPLSGIVTEQGLVLLA